MVDMSTIPRDRVWTRDDLASLPDDGNRYEILDGALLVTPSPTSQHQFSALGIYRQLFAAVPAHLRVGVAPLDVVLDDATVLQPDVFVARRDRIEQHCVRGRPELAVEVLSPGTRAVDRSVKFERYQRAGTPAYWLADPDELTLTAYELRDGRLEQVAHVTREVTWTSHVPFEVTIVPSTWLD